MAFVTLLILYIQKLRLSHSPKVTQLVSGNTRT